MRYHISFDIDLMDDCNDDLATEYAADLFITQGIINLNVKIMKQLAGAPQETRKRLTPVYERDIRYLQSIENFGAVPV